MKTMRWIAAALMLAPLSGLCAEWPKTLIANGDFEAGMVAAATSPFVSVVSGGLACIAGVAVLSLLVPEFRRYHARERA